MAYVKVTVVKTTTATGTAISISADPDPLDIGGESNDVEVTINWELVNSAGWKFVAADQGVIVHGSAAKFKNNGGSSNWQKHQWVRHKHQKDGNPYKYTISVTEANGDNTVTWDPWIRN